MKKRAKNLPPLELREKQIKFIQDNCASMTVNEIAAHLLVTKGWIYRIGYRYDLTFKDGSRYAKVKETKEWSGEYFKVGKGNWLTGNGYV